jgi:hypothetical protein
VAVRKDAQEQRAAVLRLSGALSGQEFDKTMGTSGGAVSPGGGLAAARELASIAGVKGGNASCLKAGEL